MEKEKRAIIIGSDHAAYLLKNRIRKFLDGKGFDVEDVGPNGLDSVDYPDYAIKVAENVSSGKFKTGILLCGSGIGMSMVANRFPHVRAALCNDISAVTMSRRHNDANILVMGARVIAESRALEMTDAWLKTPFDGGRHQSRLDKFDQIK